MKRISRRSTTSSGLSLSVPATWLRKPSSLYCGMNSMPDLPSFNACVTSAALFPIEETMPKPVTTTRRMSGNRRSRRGVSVLEQADLHVEHLEGGGAVGMDEAVGDAHDQPAQDHPLHVHMIGQFLDGRHDHAGELDFAHPEGAAAARRLHPAEEEARHLPQRVETEAPRHHRVALEVAGEEPQVRLDVELGHDLALAVLAALVVDLDDAVEHQHWRQRQLRIAGAEQVPLGALDQVLESVTMLLFAHSSPSVGRPPRGARRRIGTPAALRKPPKWTGMALPRPYFRPYIWR